MSEINAIATNNYILHNIDAKKLYVQEPLFTANSGDAVYVGWRPDETVLWENDGTFSAKGLSVSFSEPASNFEYLGFIEGVDIQNKNQQIVQYSAGSACLFWTEYYSNTFRFWNTVLNVNDNGMTAGPGYIVGWSYPNGTAFGKVGSTDWEHCYKGIKKVVGINRKENA